MFFFLGGLPTCHWGLRVKADRSSTHFLIIIVFGFKHKPCDRAGTSGRASAPHNCVYAPQWELVHQMIPQTWLWNFQEVQPCEVLGDMWSVQSSVLSFSPFSLARRVLSPLSSGMRSELKGTWWVVKVEECQKGSSVAPWTGLELTWNL